MDKWLNKIHCGDVLSLMKDIPNESIHCIITSPPYWQLRDYGYADQWGLESTYQEYLEHLWEFMDECKRVLKKTGTAWINLGDTYGTQSGGLAGDYHDPKNKKATENIIRQSRTIHKCLLLIPHRFAIGCIDRDWVMRNDIIWAKRNSMPESVTDRFSKKHEYFFFMAKNQKYYFGMDGIRDKSSGNRWGGDKYTLNDTKYDDNINGLSRTRNMNIDGMRNPGSVSDFWDIPTVPSSEKHYASFNYHLIEKPIVAGCPEFVCKKCGKSR